MEYMGGVIWRELGTIVGFQVLGVIRKGRLKSYFYWLSGVELNIYRMFVAL